MKKPRLLPFVHLMLCLLTLALELLPFGAKLNFGGPEGQVWVMRYSYFNLTPFGYAHFSPFLTAIMTCITISLSLAYVITQGHGTLRWSRRTSVATAVLSLCPLLLGIRFYSLVGALITLTLVLASVTSFLIKPPHHNKIA